MAESKHHDFLPPSRTASEALQEAPAAVVAREALQEAPAAVVSPARPALPGLPGVRRRQEAPPLQVTDLAGSSRQLTLSENARGDFADRFDSDELLGKGAFGSVHRCRDKSSGELVAVKVLNDKEDLGCSCATGADGERYRVAIMALDCPNILKYLGVFDGSSALFVVMELLDGTDFFDFMTGLKRFSEFDAAGWIGQILTALAYIHGRGLSHRDVKPENVMWSGKGSTGALKLVDFGLATLDLEPRALRRQDAVGTLLYCAPEVLAGSANMTCDVWAVGIMAYTMFAGDLPYDVSRDCHPAKDRGLPMPSPVWDKVSSTAQSYVRKLLLLDPLLRPSSNEALDQLWAASPTAAIEVVGERRKSLSRSMVSSRASARYVSNRDQQRAIEERLAAEERQAAARQMWAWQNQCL